MNERGIVEIPTFCGVMAYVTPLSPHTRQAVIDYVMNELPDFDDSPFREKLENTLDPNATVLNENDPEYIRLKTDLENKRVFLRNRLFFETAVEFKFSQKELIGRFDDQIKKLKRFTPDEDEWEIVLHQIILARDTERTAVLHVIIDRLELTPGEVEDGMKIFRPQVS